MSKVPDTKAASTAKSATSDDAKDAKATQATQAEDTKSDAKPATKAEAPKPGTKPAPETHKKPTAKHARKSRGPGFLSGVVVAALIAIVAVGAAAMTARDWWPKVEPYVGDWVAPYLPGDPEADAEAARLAALEARVGAMETAAQDNASTNALADLEAARAALSAQISEIMTRLDEAEAALASLRSVAASRTSTGEEGAVSGDMLLRIEELETAVASANRDQAAGADALADLGRQIEAMQAVRSEASAASGRSQALALAASQLRSAISTGQPFADQLAVLSAAGGDDTTVAAILDRLEPLAVDGVATLDELRRGLSARAAAISNAGHAVDGDDWTSQAINSIQSLVTVRRVDDADIGTVDGALAAAESRLADGDLAGAVAAVSALEDAARDAASPWLVDAEARLAAEAALADLQAHAIRLLTPAEG